ncbi:hypothetical protein ZIOFF_068913 [Zingiber officinale]|uniref:Uncharacterized protein n=1 Tax=Zingiber officinale TaxID=94328 RepID=A0A8J5EU00_ZINOF|nr:hypothetical protein ZIOFF_068913 [Zingiber officinale]
MASSAPKLAPLVNLRFLLCQSTWRTFREANMEVTLGSMTPRGDSWSPNSKRYLRSMPRQTLKQYHQRS